MAHCAAGSTCGKIRAHKTTTHAERRIQVPVAWRKRIALFFKNAQASALWVGIAGGLQVLVSLFLWQILFRSYPLGLSMALTLVGFGSWFLSFFANVGGRRNTPLPMRSLDRPPISSRLPDQAREQIERSGCGCILLISSLVPLGIAFALRLLADFRMGKTWSDIFPSMP